MPQLPKPNQGSGSGKRVAESKFDMNKIKMKPDVVEPRKPLKATKGSVKSSSNTDEMMKAKNMASKLPPLKRK